MEQIPLQLLFMSLLMILQPQLVESFSFDSIAHSPLPAQEALLHNAVPAPGSENS